MPSQSASLTAPPKGEPSSTSNTPAASAMFADSSPKGGAKFHFKYAGSVRNVRCQRLQRRGRSQVPPQIRLQRPQCSLPAPAKERPEPSSTSNTPAASAMFAASACKGRAGGQGLPLPLGEVPRRGGEGIGCAGTYQPCSGKRGGTGSLSRICWKR